MNETESSVVAIGVVFAKPPRRRRRKAFINNTRVSEEILTAKSVTTAMNNKLHVSDRNGATCTSIH